MTVDSLTLALAIAAAVAFLVAAIFYRRARKTGRALDAAIRKIGIERPKRTSRMEALSGGLERLDGHIATAQRDRAQLISAMEDTSLGILTVTDGGNVTFLNGSAQRILGAKIGQPITEPRLKAVLDEVVVTRATATQEIEMDGAMRRVLRLEARPIDYGVESLGAVLYIEDLSEQRRVDAVRRDFISNVGHELKTPLGALSILADTIQETDDEAVRDKLAERLAAEASRMAVMVDGLLELSRVESTGAPAHPVPINILIPDAVGRVRLTAEEAGVDIVVGALPEVSVAGEKRQLVAAVAELIENAIRYSRYGEEEGSDRVWVRVAADEEWVAVDVQDQGIGIPESHLGRIFERFYRVDRDRPMGDAGTGIGLSIVRHVALNHGGEIAVSSEVGKGSTFTLRLPRWKG